MKIFNNNGKINFVDINNVFVGFDYEASCCESFGYFLSAEILNNLPDKVENGDDFNLEDYVFDKTFVKEHILSPYDEGGSVAFRLVKDSQDESPKEVLYLTLYNFHNGYYGHGFEMTVGDEKISSGYL